MAVQGYNVEKFEKIDSCEEQKQVEHFHEKRTAFLIIDGIIKFLQGSKMSHWEWAKTLGVDAEKFNSITRGYAMDNNIVFYKGNFEYDDSVIADAEKFASDIKLFAGFEKAKVFVGLDNIGIGKVWPPKTFLFDL